MYIKRHGKYFHPVEGWIENPTHIPLIHLNSVLTQIDEPVQLINTLRWTIDEVANRVLWLGEANNLKYKGGYYDLTDDEHYQVLETLRHHQENGVCFFSLEKIAEMKEAAKKEVAHKKYLKEREELDRLGKQIQADIDRAKAQAQKEQEETQDDDVATRLGRQITKLNQIAYHYSLDDNLAEEIGTVINVLSNIKSEMRRYSPDEYWYNRYQGYIKFTEMDDDYLVNVYKYCYRIKKDRPIGLLVEICNRGLATRCR